MSTIDKKDFSRIYELMSFDRGKTLYEMEKKWDKIIYEQDRNPSNADAHPDLDELGWDDYWEFPQWQTWFNANVSKYGKSKAQEKFVKSWSAAAEGFEDGEENGMDEEWLKSNGLWNSSSGNVYTPDEFKTNSGGKTVQSSPRTQTTQGKTVREQIENSAKSESINKTWVEIKKEFGSNSSKEDNIKLYNAWFKGGWRPGKPVPDEYQTTTYKSKNSNVVTTTTTTPNVENKNLTDTNGDGKIDVKDLPADTESMKSKNGNEGGGKEGGKEGESGQKDYREFDITTSENSWATFYGGGGNEGGKDGK